MIKYDHCRTSEDIDQILSIQKENLVNSIAQEDIGKEGFVIVQHDFEMIHLMNTPYPHIVARDGENVIGYALTMLKEFEREVPALVPMFENINNIIHQNESLGNVNYCVMGQICIKKGFRGQGIFKGLYQNFRDQLSNDFKYLVTEVSKRNIRSLKAHSNLGFQNIMEYKSPVDGEEWVIFLWDWK
jgi:L-amino acid N-acyltransferase YncA